MATSRPKRPLLAGIQYLRAIAASAVVVFHAGDQAGWAFKVGEAGVDLFFLLSGFLMVSITHEGSRPGPFLMDRIRRIVPAYWIATTVVLAGGLAGLFPRMQLEPEHVIASYLFIPMAHPITGMPWPLLVPGWTLNFEMFFYLIFAMTMELRSQRRQVLLLGMGFWAAVIVGLLLQPRAAIPTVYTDPILLEFVGGMAIGLWWKRERPFPAWVGWPTLAFAMLLLFGAWTLQTDHYRVAIFGVPAAILLLSVLALERRKPIGSFAVPMLIGNASYSIYLWHTLAVSVAVKLCTILQLPKIAALPIGIVCGLAVGIVGYVVIERPILNFFATRRQERVVLAHEQRA